MAALLGLQYFGMDLSVFPTQIPAVNVVIVTAELLFLFIVFRQIFSGLLFWVKQEYAFWGMPSVPVASFLYGHAKFVSLRMWVWVRACVCMCTCARRYFLGCTRCLDAYL